MVAQDRDWLDPARLQLSRIGSPVGNRRTCACGGITSDGTLGGTRKCDSLAAVSGQAVT
jgi:hypothetical protein